MTTVIRWAARDWDIAPDDARDPFIAALERESIAVAQDRTWIARRGSLRSGGTSMVAAEVETTDDLAFVFAIRHASGAITFHLAVPSHRVETRGVSHTFRFELPLRESQVTRGALETPVRLILLRVLRRAAKVAIPRLATAWERLSWRRRRRHAGFVEVTAEGLLRRRLRAVPPEELRDAFSGRTLLLIHGILSDAESAFRGLAQPNDGPDFFMRVAGRYDRILAWNHHTISRSPEDNARDLIAAMGEIAAEVDVITHSRGGIVLRNLVERSDAVGAAGRLKVRKAVIVAAPNEGSPLGGPNRLTELLTWVANLTELFPQHPFANGVSFVAESLAWLAETLTASLPGVAPLAPGSRELAELQKAPHAAGTYSALVANYDPEESVWRRMIDTGVDFLFGGANDLVVPTEGGWRVASSEDGWVDASATGCFGRGGNLNARISGGVHHVNFFEQPETQEFLCDALSGTLVVPRIDTSAELPWRRAVLRRSGGLPAAEERVQAPGFESMFEPSVRPRDIFQLALLPSGASKHQLVARYRNALVVEDFRTRRGRAGSGMHTIISMHERIRRVLDGQELTSRGEPLLLPERDELLEYGTVLFDTLFPGEVRRLYDVARSLQRGTRLDVIFTSSLDWIADKPWEFAYDRSRAAFLATEDVNFTRNVFTAVPSEPLLPGRGPLRLLIVSAQPVGTAKLSIDAEEEAIRRALAPLQKKGVAVVQTVRATTASMLHQSLARGQWDVVHFIGHGVWDADSRAGYLLLQDDAGRPQPVDSRALREIFGYRGIRVVFLNACETGMGGRTDFNRGVAPALVAGGVPAVMANQYKVLDTAATAFAAHFYGALAAGAALGDAAREARVAIHYECAPGSIDWAVPVLYARDPSERLR